MTEAQAAVGMDRLPWLTDEPKPRAPVPRAPLARVAQPRTQGGVRGLAGWVVAAMLLVAGASYWLGTQTGQRDEPEPTAGPAPKPSATVRLPEPRRTIPPEASPMAPPSQATPAPAPEVSSAPAPRVAAPEPTIERPVVKKRPARVTAKRSASKRQQRTAGAAARPRLVPRAVTARPQPLTLWPSRQSRGAYGRLVQIGAFGSRHQAKLGWRRMVRSYPAVGRLPAVVVEARNSRGRRFYRFQIGTTSHAHSEVLCQRMQRIRFSCAVVGLPWKPRGVER